MGQGGARWGVGEAWVITVGERRAKNRQRKNPNVIQPGQVLRRRGGGMPVTTWTMTC